MLDSSIKLQGKFKFDVYNEDGSLDFSTEKGNFITPTGLSYINEYAIADCFRYLSVGTGSGQNTILSGGTTGLQFPLTGSGYTYIGGNEVSHCTNRRGNQYFGFYCGTSVESSGLKLARGWRIPSTGFFAQDYNLNEFMVTPGPPIVNGYFSGPTGICHCNQQVYVSSSEVGDVVAGIESIDFYSTYPNICKSDKAFARVIQPLAIKQSQYILAQYFILVSLDTGVKTFSFPSSRDNTFDGITGEGAENWNGSSGIYNLVLYGLKRISNGDVSSSTQTNNQINSLYEFRVGESYISNVGQALEPSCPMDYRTGYLSSDNIQCFANETGYEYGEHQSRRINELPSGTCYFNPYLGDSLVDNRYTHLRKYDYFPSQKDFNFFDFYPLTEVLSTLPIVKSGVSRQLVNSPTSGRTRSQILSFQFVEPAVPQRFPVRSFTMGYRNTREIGFPSTTFYPIVDMIFYPRDSSGNFFKNPSPLGLKFNSGNYTGSVFFPTGFGSIYTPYIKQQQTITSGTIDITSSGYWLWHIPHNRKFDLTYPVPPGNGDCFTVEDDTVDSRLHSDVRLTGYALPESYWITGANKLTGLYWTGGLIPTEAIQFNVNLGIRSMEHPDYQGAATPYVTIGCYILDSFSNVPTGSGNFRVFFTGSINGQIKTPYIGRISFKPTAEVEVQTNLTGFIGEYNYYTEHTSYHLPVGMAMKSENVFTGGYSYFDENNLLLMQFKLDWSSPCPSGVLGC